MTRINGIVNIVNYVYAPTWPRASMPQSAIIVDTNGSEYDAVWQDFNELPKIGQKVSFIVVPDKHASYKRRAINIILKGE